jgi:hypothetical protein
MAVILMLEKMVLIMIVLIITLIITISRDVFDGLSCCELNVAPRTGRSKLPPVFFLRSQVRSSYSTGMRCSENDLAELPEHSGGRT